jgi:hypothetical protein
VILSGEHVGLDDRLGLVIVSRHGEHGGQALEIGQSRVVGLNIRADRHILYTVGLMIAGRPGGRPGKALLQCLRNNVVEQVVGYLMRVRSAGHGHAVDVLPGLGGERRIVCLRGERMRITRINERRQIGRRIT